MNNFVLQNREVLSDQNYIRKADPNSNYWLDLSRNRISGFIDRFNEGFNIIIAGDKDTEGDFFVIPFAEIKKVLTNDCLSNDKEGRTRWVGRIKNFQLKINNSDVVMDLSPFYGNPRKLSLEEPEEEMSTHDELTNETEENEYAIQNRTIELEVRQKQSVFRRNVLKNFNNRCCLTGITEEPLLIASHIVPWSKRIDSRLDPGNGLCLSPLYDKLFDRGFITFENDLRVRTTSFDGSLSIPLQRILEQLESGEVRATQPINKNIGIDYLEYHRDTIFIH